MYSNCVSRSRLQRGWCEFCSVEVFHDQCLGVGSYGKVCRAKCDQLPCAAKLLHSTLFEDNDPGEQSVTRKFEQECQFLSTVKHPHIVQYLGTARDRNTGRPILLMELMDESLTKFVEKAGTSLPYHVQVNICHDVALALDYLHSNNIVHRDLSSNNVLLLAGSRAKVTDFGMSKLIAANPRMTPLTQCPGMQVYMPPEALNPTPRYTHKLDCFSLGVMVVQVVTGLFPDPGEASEFVDNPDFPTGRVIVCFPEVKRRQKHIELIDPTHPLLPVALDCLKDRESERPSARELCQRLTHVKEEALYRESYDSNKEGKLLEAANSKIKILEAELQKATETLKEREHQMAEAKLVADEKLAKRELECQELSRHLEEKDELVQLLQRIIAGREAIARWPKSGTSQSNTKPKAPTRAAATAKATPSNREDGRVLAKNALSMEWRKCQPAPTNLIVTADSSTVHGNTTYFAQGGYVHAYHAKEDKWSKLAPCRKEDFSLSVIEGNLTAIGGYQRHYNATNSLLSLSLGAWSSCGDSKQQKWEEIYPPMPTKRAFTTVVSTSTCLIVAGGQMQMTRGVVQTVEVMNIESRQWFVAADVPFSYTWPRMVLNRDTLFFTGATNTNKVFTCKLDSLLDTSRPAPDPPFYNQPSLAASPVSGQGEGEEVWLRVADTPVKEEMMLVVVRGSILSLGGRDETRQPVGTVYEYDHRKDQWVLVGQMATPRSLCCAAVQASGDVVVFGGHTTSLVNSMTDTTTELGVVRGLHSDT